MRSEKLVVLLKLSLKLFKLLIKPEQLVLLFELLYLLEFPVIIIINCFPQIQMDSPIEGNTISSNDDRSEIQAIVNVKARKSSLSSRDSTPKRTKLMINTRGEDIEYNFPSHEEPRDDEDLEVSRNVTRRYTNKWMSFFLLLLC